ncbi:MCE family protein [Roseomonas sp. KE2513]|uniref:PqiB family protein n=1 Tax=Roseomonas sp. KE2513 TaxID=2479202 RepID=UPI0018DFB8C1|nr:MlaD family protein [Roseomonas sp. KE2513]MBI0535065.1 MCE family protein [Roseomonas sp. KE2513]
MSGQGDAPGLPEPAEARTRRRRLSFIWLVPVVALFVAGYLGYRTLSDRGPVVTVTFRNADGLTAGQTQVRYKAVPVGAVETVRLSEDLQRVRVGIRMNAEMEGRLTEHARFWVVRPRLTAGNVSGLETIVSGSYIEFDPGRGEGEAKRDFAGLEDPPGVRSDEPGRVFTLEARRIGSLDRGSPVIFHDVAVGEVLGYDPPGFEGSVTLRVFVRSPYDRFLREGSRFWNASGVDLRVGAEGVKLQLESLRAVLSGGVAFDTPPEFRDQPPVRDGARFQLFEDLEAAIAATSRERLEFLLYFDGSLHGLSPGAPVELRGVRVGTVLDRGLAFDAAREVFLTPVRIAIEPSRISFPAGREQGGTADEVLVFAQRMVAKGMRAQLQSASLLTGQMLVSIDFLADAPPAEVQMEGETIVLPTLGGGSDIMGAVSGIAGKIERLPLEEIARNLNDTLASVNRLVGGPELRGAVGALSSALQGVQELVRSADAGLTPLMRRLPGIAANLDQAIGRANTAVASIQRGYGGDSVVNRELERLLGRANETARSIRLLADYLDRHPEALVRGRTDRATER